jgi:hypothetical protein
MKIQYKWIIKNPISNDDVYKENSTLKHNEHSFKIDDDI